MNITDDNTIKNIISAHILLAICIALYLIWWCITFKPGGNSTLFGNICITFAFITGIAGILWNILGFRSCKSPNLIIPNWQIALGGLILYIVLLLALTFIAHRQLTTELFLIIGWAVLELVTVNVSMCKDALSNTFGIVLVAMIVVVVVVSLICYMKYYSVDAMRGWIYGMVPLILSGSVMLVIIISLSMSQSKLFAV